MPDSTILHDTSDLHVKRKRKIEEAHGLTRLMSSVHHPFTTYLIASLSLVLLSISPFLRSEMRIAVQIVMVTACLVQYPVLVHVQMGVFMTPEGKGWGLQALDELPKGAFVCEYIGEILTIKEMHERNLKKGDTAKRTYQVKVLNKLASTRASGVGSGSRVLTDLVEGLEEAAVAVELRLKINQSHPDLKGGSF
ncbi:hypothetical protein EUGRSUZ_D02001 [Eucalyptus grandis]|uniref:Uncharacterized protein n=2 Tax=Eucalyptus grandis TaxID=71139 RepID=A0ACC3L7B2_EUCGR|nr:hypothetical protein EUGRSUZ_D02001 [Eucalyptus grandis]